MSKYIAVDRKFIPYGILHYYSSGQTCEEAVASLLRSHEKNPKLFPRVHAQEVEFWYESFKNENYDFSQSPRVARHTKLENLPVLNHVFHRVNAADQQSLLKTCKQFKHMIEGENRLFERVEFRMSNDSIMLQVTCGIKNKKNRTVYTKNGEGCTIIKDKKKSESEKDYMTAALYDFSKIVQMIHTKIKRLTFKYSEFKVTKKDRIRFMTGITGILSSLKEKLHVEDLEMSCHEPHELESILQTLKPGILTKLELNAYSEEKEDEDIDDDIDDEEEDEVVFKIKDSQIFKQQFTHLTNFCSNAMPLDLKPEDFAHIPEVLIEITELRPEDVKAHREKLLQFPKFKRHQIFDARRFRILDENYDQEWARAMEPYKKNNKDFEENDGEMSGTIPYRDGTGDVLHFETENCGMTFSRETKEMRKLMRENDDDEMGVEDEDEEEEEE